MPNAEIGGVQLYFEDGGSGPPMLFIHGIPTDHRAWRAQVDAVVPHRRAITYSRRYASPNRREGDLLDSTVENNAEDAAGLLKYLMIPAADVVGHSYGGFIAAYLAAKHPALVRSLVLVEPAISTMLVKDPTSRSDLLRLLLRSPSVALSGNRFLKKMDRAYKALDARDPDEAVRLNLDAVEEREGVLDGLPAAVQEMMKANARTIREILAPVPRFTREDAAQIHCPTLVLGGERSPLWLRRIADLTAGAIRGSRRITIPAAAHFPHLENSAAFNAALAEFLRRIT